MFPKDDPSFSTCNVTKLATLSRERTFLRIFDNLITWIVTLSILVSHTYYRDIDVLGFFCDPVGPFGLFYGTCILSLVFWPHWIDDHAPIWQSPESLAFNWFSVFPDPLAKLWSWISLCTAVYDARLPTDKSLSGSFSSKPRCSGKDRWFTV